MNLNHNEPRYKMRIWLTTGRFQIIESRESHYLRNSEWFGSITEVAEYLLQKGARTVQTEMSLPKHLRKELEKYGITAVQA